jgi:hypothetical protein
MWDPREIHFASKPRYEMQSCLRNLTNKPLTQQGIELFDEGISLFETQFPHWQQSLGDRSITLRAHGFKHVDSILPKD